VIVMSDHSQTKVEESVNLAAAFEDARVLTPADPAPIEAELAVCPAARSAMVYALDESRREELVGAAVATLGGAEGVDLIAWRVDGQAVVRSERGEARFAPGESLRDRRGRGWSVEGSHAVLELDAADGLVTSSTYPDALNRLWSALECPHSGDVLVSASPGLEFLDWGGADHVGGGSHGSLRADDSQGVLLVAGMDLQEREEWALTDVAPLVLRHFDVPLPG
jgi:hypothetical protein